MKRILFITFSLIILCAQFIHAAILECDLRQDMRKLWEDHIVYTRNVIISALADLNDLDVVVERLLKNQDHIGTAIEPFYGKDAEKKLTSLLREHITIALDVVKAAKKGKPLKKIQEAWTNNADEIATFLSESNPNWDKDTLLKMLQTHLDLTTKEAAARIEEDWKKDIEAYDENHEHMLMLADALTDGLVKQFPEKFANE